MGWLQPLSVSVTPDSFDSACQSCICMGLMAKLCSVTLIPFVSARGAAAP